MSKYSELLKDPRWQKKRLEIMVKDNFQCQCCFDRETTLVVHHKSYNKDKKPWEYENNDLITLCENCHKLLHDHHNLKYTGDLWKMSKDLGVNFTDYFILHTRVIQICNQGRIKEAIQLLTSNIITEEQI